jgi:myo-inositol-1-phosphate synthase
MNTIKIAIIGVGNATSNLLQGLQYYETNKDAFGIWHPIVGGYGVSEVRVVAAYDIDERKVGKDLSTAAFEKPNSPTTYFDLKPTGIEVQPGLLEEDLPSQIRNIIRVQKTTLESFTNSLKSHGVDIAVLLMTSGISRTAKLYTDACISAGVCVVNATPNLVACLPEYEQKFIDSNLVGVGDDLISQFGGTVFHKGILDFMNRRGIKIEKSYQLDVGGGLETLNTIDEEVRASKRDMKTQAISLELPYQFKTAAGTTDYVDYMGNNRTSYFWILGKAFLGSEVKFDIYLRTNDGANAGNILLDVIRAVKRAKDKGESGIPQTISCYGFKKTLRKRTLEEAETAFQREYISDGGAQPKRQKEQKEKEINEP